MSPILTDIIKAAQERGIATQRDLQKLKNSYAKKYNAMSPQNLELTEAYRELIKEGSLKPEKRLERLFRKRGVRSSSGIASVTAMTKGYSCPGKCVFCPTEPEMPKSYLSNEPAMMRAILNNFHPKNQVLSRLRGLEKTGHPTDKIEMIVSGGSFNAYPRTYQTSFIRQVYNALNHPAKPARSLAEATKINETAMHRCIGLSVETRPDLMTEHELIRFREMGVTKLETGIQHVNDRILEINKRGHSVARSKEAVKLIKDAGFKINIHMMPNLLGSTLEDDYQMFVDLFADPAWRPDWMKIYPCVVTPYSELEHIWRRGEFTPYTDTELADLMLKVKKIIPRYVRVTRLYRDIPAETILAGCKISNLRQILHKRMEHEGVRCNCIRCREIKETPFGIDDLELHEMDFEASDGREFFLTWDTSSEDKLVSLLRLRFPSQLGSGKKHFIKELEGCAIVRELHTYGTHIKVGKESDGAPQHLGLGKKLVQRAEEITEQNGIKKLAIIAGVGVRKYYEKLGYSLKGTYMIKNLSF